VHGENHVVSILDRFAKVAAEKGRVRIDADTGMSSGSAEAALRAAGAVIRAVDEVMTGHVRNAFCAVRPPGHHAERERAMGFCLFNSVAVGAAYAREKYGVKRIAIVDFDVHHGNGTQDIFFNDKESFYASTHQSPLYPGTGMPAETGIKHNVLNVPLPPGAGGEHFRAAMTREILPALDTFKPELLFISAGFDAHRADPLAALQFEEADYAWATSELAAVARRHAGSRIVSSLEGGYDLGALARSAAAHVRALMEA
jgi:acetoin utilization deacetylase AcuC-like enzyme